MPPHSVLRRLQSHELGMQRNNYRSSLQSLRSLIKNEDSSYRLVWQADSRKPIFYEDRKIFFDNFSIAYGLWGGSGKPALQFRLPGKTSFEEVVIQTTKINRLPVPAEQFAPLLAGLTRSNQLIRFNATTGKKLDTIHLGPTFKFHNFNWQVTGETLLLQSVYFKKALAFVDVNPFKFVAMIELTTDVVGADAKNANVGEDILIIGCPAKHMVKLYSMPDLLSDKHSDKLCACDFGQSCERSSQSHGPVGAEGFGLPVTHKIKSLPPVLFQLKTSDHSVQFGGFPMHYLFKQPGKSGVYKLMDLMTDKPIDYQFDLTDTECGTDQVMFHYDESGRILFVQRGAVHFLKIRDIEKCDAAVGSQCQLPVKVEQEDTYEEPEVQIQCKLELLPKSELVKQENISPNRCNRPRRAAASTSSYCSAFRPERPLLCIDHENETEFFSILGIANLDQSSSICMFDNADGSFVKRIPVPDLDEEDDHKLIVDLDHIIFIRKRKQEHQVFVYQLTRGETVIQQKASVKLGEWSGSIRINDVDAQNSPQRVKTRSKKVKPEPRR